MNPAAPDAAAPLWARVRSDIGRRANTFAAAAARVRIQADDDALHDLRVSIRRLIAALELWRGGLDRKPARRARNRLRDLRRAIGPVRELEVHTADLSRRLRDQTLAIRLVGADVLDTMRRELEHDRKSAARRCREKRVSRILRAVWRACESLESTLGSDTGPSVLPQSVLKRSTRVSRAAMTAALLEPSTVTLHNARIALKRWRYALEAAAPNSGGANLPKPATLRPLQEALGVVQDAATLSARLTRYTRGLQDRDMLVHAEALRPLILEVDAELRSAIERFTPLARQMVDLDDAAALLSEAEPTPRADSDTEGPAHHRS